MQITNNTNGPKSVNTVNGVVNIEVGQSVTVSVYAREKGGIEAAGLTVSGIYAANLGENSRALSREVRPHIYNYNSGSLSKFKDALQRSSSGGVRLRYVRVGDSVTAGAGSGTGTNAMTDAFDKAPPAYLARMLQNDGLNVNVNTLVFDAANPNAGLANGVLYNSRLSFSGATDGSAWTRNAQMYSNAATTDDLVFQPKDLAGNVTATDTLVVCTIAGTGVVNSGDFVVKDNNATVQTVAQSTGAQRMLVTTVTRTKSTNPWKIAKAAANSSSLFVEWFEAYDSTSTQISIFNAGLYGYASSGWNSATQVWDKRNLFKSLAPDVVELAIGVNDVRTNVSAATYKSQMQAIIAAVKAAGSDVWLARYHPDNAPVNPSLLPAYRQVQYELADENNCPLIDLTKSFVSYDVASSRGYMSDTLHLLPLGSAALAESSHAFFI